MKHSSYARPLMSMLAVVLLAGCTKPEEGGSGSAGEGGKKAALSVKGSDTMVQLAQAWAQAFMKANPGIAVSVTGGGSGTGIKALVNGTTDIADASRPMKDEEKQQVAAKGREVQEFVVAQDALSIIVHPDNPVGELTLAQLKDIYTGKVTNWNQMGGPDLPIVINSRETSSGTYVFFQEHVLDNQPYAKTAMLQPATSQIVNNVARDRGGIGYVGLGYVNSSVKSLKIKKDASSPAVAANVEDVVNGSYPLARPLFNYTAGKPDGAVKTWLDWVRGPEGQAIVKKLDFVPIK